MKNLTPFKLNHYVLRAFYILIGPLITWPILDEEGPLRFIGLSLLFSAYHLAMLLFWDLLPNFSGYLESEAPLKNLTAGQKRFSKASRLFFLVLLGCFLGSIRILDRTIHSIPVFWSLIGIGLLLAVFLIIRSVKKPFSFINSNNATYFGIGFLLGTPMLLCSLFFIPNRYIIIESMKNKPVPIIEKSLGSRGKRGGETHYIFLLLDGKSERITVGSAQFEVLTDTAYCDMSRGIFGYTYINKISYQSTGK